MTEQYLCKGELYFHYFQPQQQLPVDLDEYPDIMGGVRASASSSGCVGKEGEWSRPASVSKTKTDKIPSGPRFWNPEKISQNTEKRL